MNHIDLSYDSFLVLLCVFEALKFFILCHFMEKSEQYIVSSVEESKSYGF